MKTTRSIIRNQSLKVVALFGLLALAVTTLWAASSGNIILSGAVATINDITITPQSGYNSLNLTTGGTDQTVAVVNEKNNSFLGYSVTLASANALLGQARLKGTDVLNSNVINYSIKYGVAGSEASVTLNALTGTATVTDVTAPTASGGVNKNLKITFSGSSYQNADTYSDTLTLTIISK